jgi:hypothetical protein
MQIGDHGSAMYNRVTEIGRKRHEDDDDTDAKIQHTQ